MSDPLQSPPEELIERLVHIVTQAVRRSQECKDSREDLKRRIHSVVSDQLRDAYHGEWDAFLVHLHLKKMQHEQRLAMERLETLISSQTDRISAAIDAQRPMCRLAAKSSSGDGEHLEFISAITPASEDQPWLPNPTRFLDELANEASAGDTLVLVDPYALADHDDAGKVTNCLSAIEKISSKGSISRLFIICREQETNKDFLPALERLMPKKKIEVQYQDTHDRYLLVAGEDKFKHSQFVSGAPFARDQWRGVAFGASLNGIARRPTYILRFGSADLEPLLGFLTHSEKIASNKRRR